MVSKELFNNGWEFLRTDFSVDIDSIKSKEQEFVPTDIPHDWLVEDADDMYATSRGWYRKNFNKPEIPEGGKMLLRFEAVYMDSTVFLNGEKVYEWKYGYSTFDVDLTEGLKDGENEIIVRVDYNAPNSRWYSGAGIFRDIHVYVCGKDYLPLDGTYVHSKAKGDGSFDLELETEAVVSGASKVAYELVKKDNPYLKNEDLGLIISLGEAEVKDGRAVLNTVVENVKIWDIENPELYTLKVSLLGETGEALDSDEITVGFRTFEFTVDKGFFLNGRHVKLHGVCEHHDLGALGAVFKKAAMRRKLKVLRKMGVNAIRTSHNMPAIGLMELCDEMGFLVVSEAFDMWEEPKTPYDYARFFDEWVEKDVRSWVRRDRNCPSVLMWSIGNEIHDTHASAHGVEIATRLRDDVLLHDRKQNAFVTIGSNYMAWDGGQNCAEVVKFAGYNYGEHLYDEHREKHKDWLMYGSETASVVQSRGIYHFPLEVSCLSDIDGQCSSLGNSTTSWGARSHNICIANDRDREFIAGMFLWSGFDYIGEPTPYSSKNSFFGQIDTAGFPKDSYYIYKAEWTDAKKNPFVHIYPYWAFNEGELIDIGAATNGDFVEIFVNGKSLGMKAVDHTKGSDQLLYVKTVYEPGEIMAVAYDKDKNEIAREVRKTFSDGVKLVAVADKDTYLANGEDIIFVELSLADKDGNEVSNATNYVKLSVEGEGRLIGTDNGDSTDYDSYKSPVRRLFSGKLLAMVETTTNAGEIKIKAEAKGVEAAEVVVKSVGAEVRKGIACDYKLKEEALCPTVPVRDIDIKLLDMNNSDNILDDKQDMVTVEATIYPENATDLSITWEVVNGSGIPVDFVEVKEISVEKNVHKATIRALGDGEFIVRALSYSRNTDENGNVIEGKHDIVRVISRMQFKAENLGTAFMNPYNFISAGLHDEIIGDIVAGLEKGVATGGHGRSGIVYNYVDFGDYGSDEISIQIFAFNDELYPIEVWEGVEGEEGAKLLGTMNYKKPSIWNTYQAETLKLDRRIKGVKKLSIIANAHLHIKGFDFKKYDKAFSEIDAAECTTLYGDDFVKEERAVKGIGNNVVVGFDNMDFGDGASKLLIKGFTDLPTNTIHVRFTNETGIEEKRIVEFPGGVNEASFEFEAFTGKGQLNFIFLPGCKFDFESFKFSK